MNSPKEWWKLTRDAANQSQIEKCNARQLQKHLDAEIPIDPFKIDRKLWKEEVPVQGKITQMNVFPRYIKNRQIKSTKNRNKKHIDLGIVSSMDLGKNKAVDNSADYNPVYSSFRKFALITIIAVFESNIQKEESLKDKTPINTEVSKKIQKSITRNMGYSAIK